MDKKKSFIIYSLGYFISQKSVDHCPQKLSAVSVILNLIIKRDLNSKIVSIEYVSCVPTWIYHDEKEKPVSVLAIPDELENNNLIPEFKDRLINIQKRIHGIITTNDVETPETQWVFSLNGILQHMKKHICPQDIHYLLYDSS